MIRRSKEEWLALIEAHQQSGLTQKAFCQEHQLDPGYFSQRRRQLLAQAEPADSGFVQVLSPPASPGPDGIRLRFGATELQLPASAEPAWVARLLRELSA